MGVLAVIILIFGFIGGIKEGIVKEAFSLVTLIISILFAGMLYSSVGSALSFLPDPDWENFTGFIVVFALISILFSILSWMPRKSIETFCHEGIIFRLGGGILNLFNTAAGITVFSLLFITFPVWPWMREVLTGSGIITGLISLMSFIQGLLPEIFHQVSGTVV
jgi:uncharacterized membrane protein required for colicin V production